MKNIITIILIILLPIIAYFVISKNSKQNEAIAKENAPTVITFTSTMCLDCKKMKSLLAEVTPNYNTKINFEYINALNNDKKTKEKIKQHDVVLVPTLIFIDNNGNTKKKIEGYIPKETLINELEALSNG